jgi:hypothetical protein
LGSILSGFNGEDTNVDDKERDVGLKEPEVGWSGGRPADNGGGGGSTEGGVTVFSVESAGEEPLGEGAGVVDLDGSRDIISKGFVFIWDDGSIV